MKRILMVAATGLLVSCLFAPSAWAFGIKDVEAMTRDGVPDSVIVAKIRHGGATFHLDAKDFRELRAAGVSNDVVMAMVRTEDAWNRVPHPYAWWGDPWWPYRSPWSAEFGFGWYAPWPHEAWGRAGRRFDRDDYAWRGGGGRPRAGASRGR